jgi:hypothetical protein
MARGWCARWFAITDEAGGGIDDGRQLRWIDRRTDSLGLALMERQLTA